MFESQPQAEIEALMKANSEFRQLYYRHRELDRQVLDAELGVLPIDDATLGQMKREKLAAQLIWLANKHELGLPEDRRHDRLMPRNTASQLMLEDGAILPCRIMDLSFSGAAVDVDARPQLGSAVRLGSLQGRIVRHFMEGVAIEFNRVQTRETLREFL